MRPPCIHGLLLTLTLFGCKGGGVNLVRTPGVGRVETCPEGAVAVEDGLGPGPNDTRCSYADAIGQGVTTMSGQVRADDGAVGIGLAGVVVSVHALSGPATPDDPGPSLASATTDAQGSFHFSVVLDPGDYLLVARDEGRAQALAYRSVSLEAAARRQLEDLILIVPADERISSPSESR